MLFSRVAWKCETNSFGISFVVNDKIVAFRLAGEITVDDFRNEQAFPFTTFFQLVVDRSHFIANKRLIFLRRFPTLLELPLSFEQSGFVNECEDLVERDVVNNARTVKRQRGNRHIFSNLRTHCMGCVTGSLNGTTRFCPFANSQFRFFSYEVLGILAQVYLLPLHQTQCLCVRSSEHRDIGSGGGEEDRPGRGSRGPRRRRSETGNSQRDKTAWCR